MALQVQVLTEQVSAQSDKIADLERIILDKTQQLSHSEDLLQRVNVFTFHCFNFVQLDTKSEKSVVKKKETTGSGVCLQFINLFLKI